MSAARTPASWPRSPASPRPRWSSPPALPRGRMWAQILADVLGVPARVPVVKESSALGAAVCAGLGAGLYSSLADVDRLVRFEYTAEPDPARAARYDELYAEWATAYAGLLEPANAGAVRPLWRASGT